MSFRVIPMSSGEYDVMVESPRGVRNHRVAVGPALLRDVGADHEDGEQVVTAALDYLDDEQRVAEPRLVRGPRHLPFTRRVRRRGPASHRLNPNEENMA